MLTRIQNEFGYVWFDIIELTYKQRTEPKNRFGLGLV